MDNEYLDRAQQDAMEKVKAEKKKKKKRKKATTATRKKSNGPSAFVQILNGDFLTKEFILNNLNFIFFLMFLLIVTVGKGYYGKQLSSNVIKTQKELDQTTSEYFDAKARLEENTQRAILIKKLENSGLKETTNPTKVIRIEKDKNE